MYHFIEKLRTLYGLLQDEQSKEIFQARFAVDMEPSIPNIRRLVSLGSYKDQRFLSWTPQQIEVLRELDREHKKIILYGAGYNGRFLAKLLKFEHIDFYGFCGRGAERYPDGLLGKPVLSPDELVACGEEYYVMPVVAREKYYMEIIQFLHEHNYPKNHILDGAIETPSADVEKQYFEFPALYRRGTAFIDGGCFDCKTSYRFAKWCGGSYSSIIAFEPDPGNYAKCCENIQDNPLANFQLINAGLSDREGTTVFNAKNVGSSRIISAELSAAADLAKTNTGDIISIRTAAIDDIIGDRTVGFIKMDIEGAEFDALRGAKNTILRDKPLLAISVYHLRGDLFAIMDYLHQLLPEYRFYLRHYGVYEIETVLYASVDL